MEGEWWDICGSIDIGADKTGTVKLWDEDYSKDDLMAEASGQSEHIRHRRTRHADIRERPLHGRGSGARRLDYRSRSWRIMTNLIRIEGWYENGDDEFYYEIYLRPWGTVLG